MMLSSLANKLMIEHEDDPRINNAAVHGALAEIVNVADKDMGTVSRKDNELIKVEVLED